MENAFLHVDLEEEVYMKLPSGFKIASSLKKVCKLKKALYGLKQSPRAWFEHFRATMVSYNYTQGQANHTLFVKRRGSNITTLIVYVDDIIVTGNDDVEIKKMKSYLAREFEIKDLKQLRYFLVIEVAHFKRGIFISQRKYTLDLVNETCMLGCKPSTTPLDPNQKFKEDDGDRLIDVD